MAKQIPKEALETIEAVVAAHPQGMSLTEIAHTLEGVIPRRTLQYRLKYLVDKGRLASEGEKRGMKYRMAGVAARQNTATDAHADEAVVIVPLSPSSKGIQKYIRQPLAMRKPVGYNRAFLDAYRPNVSAYLSAQEQHHLKAIGTSALGEQPAGTYAKQILHRLLIDLSWNSSRLEGNTYSLLDTKRLIDFGEEAEGKGQIEAQMILNHKDAIEFLVGSAEEIGFNHHTLLNLHALLANNLLADPEAMGRLRRMVVGIDKSAFHPLEVPQLVEECFHQILATAAAITDPFEQSFFVMAQLPYLQPFDDVNKRVSRLAANIPLVKANLTPLSFTDVPTKAYTDAMLGVYELNKVDLLKDVFIWAYERSALRYAAVRQSLGEPDPFRLKHRVGLRQIVNEIVRAQMDKKSALARIAEWAKNSIGPDEQEKFREVVENELLGLHEGNFTRYQIKPSEFETWRKVWISTL